MKRILPFLLALLLAGCGQTEAPETEEQTPQIPDEPQVTEIAFPARVEDGKLEITSLFQYPGDNPDCGGETGEEWVAEATVLWSLKHWVL